MLKIYFKQTKYGKDARWVVYLARKKSGAGAVKVVKDVQTANLGEVVSGMQDILAAKHIVPTCELVLRGCVA
jgi:hypothetical protein